MKLSITKKNIILLLMRLIAACFLFFYARDFILNREMLIAYFQSDPKMEVFLSVFEHLFAMLGFHSYVAFILIFSGSYARVGAAISILWGFLILIVGVYLGSIFGAIGAASQLVIAQFVILVWGAGDHTCVNFCKKYIKKLN